MQGCVSSRTVFINYISLSPPEHPTGLPGLFIKVNTMQLLQANAVPKPPFKTGHTRYVDFVKSQFTDGCRWLDAGGGHQVFHDLYDGEENLIRRTRLMVACDIDLPSLTKHQTVENLVCCGLNRLPLPSGAFDLITSGMVFEHLADPGGAVRELARVLEDGGLLIIHTVNNWGYPTLLARLANVIPTKLKRRLISYMTNRREEDIFPALYRFNSASKAARTLEEAGLTIEEVKYWQSGPIFGRIPVLRAIEKLYLRLTDLEQLRGLRGQLLFVARR